MMQMVVDINKNNFGEAAGWSPGPRATRGIPILWVDACLPRPSFIESAGEPPPIGQPTADQIVDRYIQALGGEQASQKSNSRVDYRDAFHSQRPRRNHASSHDGGAVSQGAQSNAEHRSAPAYVVSSGFDSTAAWAQDAMAR